MLVGNTGNVGNADNVGNAGNVGNVGNAGNAMATVARLTAHNRCHEGVVPRAVKWECAVVYRHSTDHFRECVGGFIR